MNLQKINIQDIIVQDSRFSTADVIFTHDHPGDNLLLSFEASGIINPICVLKDRNNTYHLIDGIKRIDFAKKKNLDKVDAALLPRSTPPEEVMNIMLSSKINEINESVMNKVQFICFALSSGASEQWVLTSLYKPFGFRPHSGFLQESKRINNLPTEVKRFFHEKKFSFKQILNLTHLPEDILQRIISWKSMLQLTASILEELAAHIRDYVKERGISFQHFLEEPEIKEVITSDLSPRDKTEKLRKLIRLKRYPVLSETNARIQRAVEEMGLPKGISVNWDNTLENRNIDFVIHIQDPDKWEETIKSLNKSDIQKKIKKILEEL
jgi:hypothetical protein